MENSKSKENIDQTHTIQAKFVSDAGEEAGPPLDLPINVTLTQLELIINALLKNVSKKELKFSEIFICHFSGRANTASVFCQRPRSEEIFGRYSKFGKIGH